MAILNSWYDYKMTVLQKELNNIGGNLTFLYWIFMFNNMSRYFVYAFRIILEIHAIVLYIFTKF